MMSYSEPRIDIKPGRLLLVPSPLTDIKSDIKADAKDDGLPNPETILTLPDLEKVRRLTQFVVENGKRGRAWLKKLGLSPSQLEICVLETQSGRQLGSDCAQIKQLLQRMLAKGDLGIVSDAGCPCVADPGALWVEAAHQMGVEVVPLIGPSSLLMAVMASGLNGQCFGFFGYLPSDEPDRRERISNLEKLSRQWKQTILLIETPYRNWATLQALIKSLSPNTRLSISFDLMGKHQHIQTKNIHEWRHELNHGLRFGTVEVSTEHMKRPMVFSFLA
jgi:16S rRNA (cytidine1402-2'-O)-methyltransferase